MPIVTTDIQYFLTGGAANANVNASLGGAISSTAVDLTTTLHNLFDKVTGQESTPGETEYRCLAVKNGHATLQMEAAKAYIFSQIAGGTSIEIGVETPVAGAVQLIANENTAPAGVAFSAPVDYATGLVVTAQGQAAGVMPALSWCGIWVKRIVPPATAALDLDGATPKVEGDSPA